MQDSREPAEELALTQFAEKAYLDYSMYVILDRALPHIGDGLKPVQRRIVYAMSELALGANAKHKKSARTVGDVLGKFHPHGEVACYEAMVGMAQPFATRYPLIDGQGNFGAPDDPKSFAAMRYTEARLAPYTEVLLAELAHGTVDWAANFDGTLDEPLVLPARLPNLLLNGATGIAVGMATDIPPHNLREVAAAATHLLLHPQATTRELCEFVPAPDYPTEAEIISPPDELLKMYETGTGSVRARARYERENGDVIVTALPYQVSGARVLEQIAQQMNAKKLPMLEDLRDESDHENPTRLVLTLRGRADADALMQHLFVTTELERSYRVNLNMVGLDNRPAVKPLRELLGEWLAFRVSTVRRRLSHRLARIDERLHVLDGLLIAYLNIDEVIAIIRYEDEPKQRLMERFALSDIQADAILDLKLRHLARLEEMKIRAEQRTLADERDRLQETLNSETRLKKLIQRELAQDAERYGDARRSPLVRRAQAQAMTQTELVASDPVTVVLSERGWVRAAKGHEIDVEGLSYKAGDGFLAAVQTRANLPVIFLDSSGRSYALPAHTLPSARGQGEPLTGRFDPPAGVSFVGLLTADPAAQCLLLSDGGHGFIAAVEDLLVRNRAGKAVLNAGADARALAPVPLRDADEWIAVASTAGHLLILPRTELPQMPRGRGVRLLDLHAGELAVGAVGLAPDSALVLQCGRRTLSLRPADWAAYRGARARRGGRLPRGFSQVKLLARQ